MGKGEDRLQDSSKEIARVTLGAVEATFSAQPYPLVHETETELRIALMDAHARKPLQGARVLLMVTKKENPSFVNGPYVLSTTEKAGQYMVRHIFVTKGRYELAFTLESANGDGANGHLGFAFTEDVRGKKGFLRKLFGTNDKVHGGFLEKLIMVSIVLVTAVASLK